MVHSRALKKLEKMRDIQPTRRLGGEVRGSKLLVVFGEELFVDGRGRGVKLSLFPNQRKQI